MNKLEKFIGIKCNFWCWLFGSLKSFHLSHKDVIEVEEKFLGTNICPLLEWGEQESLNDCFRRELNKSDRLEIAVGFCSYRSLKELEKLVLQGNIRNVCVILGMYYFDGLLSSLYELVLEINERWSKLGIGEIRLVHSCKYHGKLYCFYRKNRIVSAIIGSPNLSFLVERQVYPSQHEIALLTNNLRTLKKFAKYLEYLKSRRISENIEILEKYKSHVEKDPDLGGEQRQSKIIYKIFSP
ncbi:hypothetical protein OVS_00680 [Mycoplasma ovis str. Michigan]|uniref:Restriction endonuclease type II NgoFVII N-terminal domain-containing protein n=1 Tax=Mycoplasma ovis str. Michigan TaxID=1415773 RepID=A0ABN4BMD5_9MOLU|nr:restriction endonuclease PLD domain-containing protein [Mycoplasma ovis]AHC40126.1 hypothetical protein OVS_00680 [Mycoplasma ovis str. Michigan]